MHHRIAAVTSWYHLFFPSFVAVTNADEHLQDFANMLQYTVHAGGATQWTHSSYVAHNISAAWGIIIVGKILVEQGYETDAATCVQQVALLCYK